MISDKNVGIHLYKRFVSATYVLLCIVSSCIMCMYVLYIGSGILQFHFVGHSSNMVPNFGTALRFSTKRLIQRDLPNKFAHIHNQLPNLKVGKVSIYFLD